MFGDDMYTYPGSGGVLKNLLNIEDATALDHAVNDIVTANWAAMSGDLPDQFDLNYLRFIHASLFGDLFEWAGQERDVELYAAGADLTYCLVEEMQARLNELFAGLEAKNWLKGLDDWDFASELAKVWGRLTYIHPFRDGNTRTQSFFFSRLAIAAGHPIDWAQIDVPVLRSARLSAAKSFTVGLEDYLRDRLLDPADLDPDDPAAAGAYVTDRA